MDKKLIVGGLAVVGAIALFMYLKPKPKRNSDEFFSANGTGGCAQCRTSDGYVYHTGSGRNCRKGDVCVAKYAFN